MIIKSANDTDFYRPSYVSETDFNLMMQCYRMYERGYYTTMQVEDWKSIYDMVIIWISSNGTTSITMPQHPAGADKNAWLEHIYKHREYYVSADRQYMVIKE